MSPAAVVVALDPEECVLFDVGEVVPWSGVDEFFFVGREEQLGDGVVEAGVRRPIDRRTPLMEQKAANWFEV